MRRDTRGRAVPRRQDGGRWTSLNSQARSRARLSHANGRGTGAHGGHPSAYTCEDRGPAPSRRARARGVETGSRAEGRSSIGRVPVSKTGCCRFKSCRPCRTGNATTETGIAGPPARPEGRTVFVRAALRDDRGEAFRERGPRSCRNVENTGLGGRIRRSRSVLQGLWQPIPRMPRRPPPLEVAVHDRAMIASTGPVRSSTTARSSVSSARSSGRAAGTPDVHTLVVLIFVTMMVPSSSGSRLRVLWAVVKAFT